MNTAYKVPRIEPVSLLAAADRRKYNFPNLEVFDQGVLIAIETFRAADVPTDKQGNALFTDAMLEGSFLTLVGKDNQIIRQDIPLVRLVTQDNNGIVYQVDPTLVNWQKSYIEIEPNVNPVAGTVAFFNLHYYRSSDASNGDLEAAANPRTAMGYSN